MNGAEFVRKMRKVGCHRSMAVQCIANRGKGRHGTRLLPFSRRSRLPLARSPQHLIVLALVVCGLGAPMASALDPPGAPDDAFLCYKTATTKDTPKFVAVENTSLVDQFASPSVFTVAKPVLLCNPADDGGAITDTNTHLAAYKVKAATGQPKPVPHLNIRVVNDIGELTVDAKKPDLLFVPTAIDLTTPPPAPDPLTHDVDHYQCYSAKPSKGQVFPKGIQVAIDDELTTAPKLFDVKKPKHLCFPVNKNGEGIENGQGHYLCYQVKPAKDQPKHTPVTAIKIGNQFAQPEQRDTKKEAELCVPSIINPTCGDNALNQSSEQCDGTDDAACPGQCSSLCYCRQQFPFVLDPAASQIQVRGVNALGAGVDRDLVLTGLAGTLTMNIDGLLRPGQYQISVPVTALPPLDVTLPVFGSVGTACVFLEEDPTLPGSGLSGIGILNCFGSPVPLLQSPDFSVYADHCTNGTACDSGMSSGCTGELGNGGKTHAITGVCVAAAPTDAMCTATDPLSGTTAKLESALDGDPHDGVCNSPLYGRVGTNSWRAGDAILTLNAAIDIRGAGDLCLGPPTTTPVRGPLTTGTAVSAIMDAFPDVSPAAGKVQAVSVSGVPFTCDGDPITGTSGVTLGTSAPLLDAPLPPPFGLADLNTALTLKAQ